MEFCKSGGNRQAISEGSGEMPDNEIILEEDKNILYSLVFKNDKNPEKESVNAT
ncbi:MAG: hypothetical protein Kow0042_01940 [Calditrichia bacterium]